MLFDVLRVLDVDHRREHGQQGQREESQDLVRAVCGRVGDEDRGQQHSEPDHDVQNFGMNRSAEELKGDRNHHHRGKGKGQVERKETEHTDALEVAGHDKRRHRHRKEPSGRVHGVTRRPSRSSRSTELTLRRYRNQGVRLANR